MEDVSSEQELLELRRDGKITEDEYKQLLEAMRKSPPADSQKPANISRKYMPWFGLAIIIIIAAAILLPMLLTGKTRPVTLVEFRRNFPQKVAKLNVDTATLDNVIKIFGEPIEYIRGRAIIDKAKIPTDRYCIKYPDDVYLYMRWDSIVELRFESQAADYAFRGKIRVGSSLDDVLEVVGQPTEIIEGEPIGWFDGVLYKDIEDTKGRCYYHRSDQNVRFFFLNYKVKAMYITRSDYDGG
ncbi:MAG: hypothetical protein ACYTBP_08975 [Planctomycetota bacterium]|jgi:hypothetical protein